MTKHAYRPSSVSLETFETGWTPRLLGPPYFLAPTEMATGVWRFEANWSRIGHPLLFISAFFLLLAVGMCALGVFFVGLDSHDAPFALGLGGVLTVCGIASIWLDRWQGNHVRWLQLDSQSQVIALGKGRGPKGRVTHSLPVSECPIRIHPITACAPRIPSWNGFALVIHVLDPERRFEPGLFVLACAKSRIALERYLGSLPPPLATRRPEEGQPLSTEYMLAAPNRSLRRRSRGLCPFCGYELGPDPRVRCPECGRLDEPGSESR